MQSEFEAPTGIPGSLDASVMAVHAPGTSAACSASLLWDSRAGRAPRSGPNPFFPISMHNPFRAHGALALLMALVGFIVAQDAYAAPSGRELRVGSERSFWVIGSGDAEYDRVRATLVHDGRFARIWVDNRDTARIDRAMLAELARGLDTATPAGSRNPAKGIIENEQEVFGASPVRFKVGGKDDFLLFDIPNTATDGLTLLGYFHTKDQYPQAEVSSSNELNMLYIDSREGLRSVRRLLSTIAHEYQHLIQFGRNPTSERFYTEALSELATVITGFRLPNGEYMANTNSPMFRWSDENAGHSQIDYQRGMMLMRYLYEQQGEAYIHRLVGTKGIGVQRIADALVAGGAGSRLDWREVLTRFAVANYLQDEGSGEFGYGSSAAAHGRRTRPAVVDIGTVPAAYRPSRARLAPYGTSYFQVDAPRSLRIAVGPNDDHRVVAITFRGDRIDVSELGRGAEHELGDERGGIERVVLAFVSLSSEGQLVDLGVDTPTRVSMN